MVHVVDSIWNAGGVINFGSFMNITNLAYPATVEANTPFEITFDAQNASVGPLNAFGYIFDFATQQQVPGSYWEAAIVAGNSYPVIAEFSGISQTFSGEIRVGHIEEGGGCINPTGAESGYVCGNPAFPSTPIIGHRYQCQDGIWADLGVDSNCLIGENCAGPYGNIGDFICGDPAYQNAPVKGRRYQCTGITGGGAFWEDFGVDPTNCPTGGGGGINPLYIIGAIAAVALVGVVFLVAKK